MTFSNRGGYNDRQGSGFSPRGGNDRGFDRPAMFDAVCARCGANCQVPFRPNGRKEVFCSKCFEQNNGGESRDFHESREPRRFDNRDSAPRAQSSFAQSGNSSVNLESINAKLDKIIKLLSPSDPKVMTAKILDKIQTSAEETLIAADEKKVKIAKKKKIVVEE